MKEVKLWILFLGWKIVDFSSTILIGKLLLAKFTLGHLIMCQGKIGALKALQPICHCKR